MKKILAMIAVCILYGIPANAQLSFGVKAGISIATQDIEYPPLLQEDLTEIEVKSIATVTGGFFLNFSPLALPISIQPELLYTIKGSETNAKQNGQPYRDKYEIHYLEIPILLKYSFPVPAITPHIFAGPVMDFKIKNDPSSILSTDFGITAGGGIDFNILTTPVTIDARYTLGLMNVYDEGTPTVIMQDGFSYKNRAIMIMLGAAF